MNYQNAAPTKIIWQHFGPPTLFLFVTSHTVFFAGSVIEIFFIYFLFFGSVAFVIKKSASASAPARISYVDIRIRIRIRILVETDIHIRIRKMTSALTSASADF